MIDDRFDKVCKAINSGCKVGPEKVMISPTDYCNLNCGICWRNEKEEKYDELTLDEIKSILEECKEMGVRIIDFTGGGEPFIRHDIFDIMKMIKDFGFFGTLTTNGTLLDKDKIMKIVDIGLDDICFSLDGHTAAINDSIRGNGVYSDVIKSIRLLKSMKNDCSSDLPVIRIGTVITSKNFKHLDDIVELAHELDINAINFSVLIEWESNRSFWMRDIDEDHIHKELAMAKRKCDKYSINSNIESILEFGVFEHKTPDFCFAPWEMVFINASGDVMACCTLASLYENIIGNIKESSLRDIWYGERMEKFRKMIIDHNLPKNCKKCIPDFTKQYNKKYNKMVSING